MSNTLGVKISGYMHYDACPFGSEERHKRIMHWLALMNLSQFGLRITYPSERYYLSNEPGGRTLFQAFSITGTEAIGMEGIYELIKNFKEIGIVTKARYRDLDNETDWRAIQTMTDFNKTQKELYDLVLLAGQEPRKWA